MQQNIDSLRLAYVESEAHKWVESSTSQIQESAMEPFNCAMVRVPAICSLSNPTQ